MSLLRRTQRRLRLLNIPIFLALLIFILYLNLQPSSPTRVFDWTTVRYKTTSRSVPAANGICPGLSTTDKPALVVARITSEDSTWLSSPWLNDKYHICTYTADAPLTTSNELQVPRNRGHESIVYLTYLIDNYATLPPASIFIHGSRFSWHNDDSHYDNLPLLAALNVSSALAPAGYHNLRCDWSAGTCHPGSSEPQGSLATQSRAMLQPWDERSVSDSLLPGALASIFGSGVSADAHRWKLGRNDAVRSQCCAQFVVARENVLRHWKGEYIALRQWLLDGSLSTSDSDSGSGSSAKGGSKRAAPGDDRIAGRILSYVWQILFIDPDYPASFQPTRDVAHVADGIDLARLNTLACPTAEDCYCRLYNNCGLYGCTRSYCPRQYHVPKDYKLPAGWEETYGENFFR